MPRTWTWTMGLPPKEHQHREPQPRDGEHSRLPQNQNRGLGTQQPRSSGTRSSSLSRASPIPHVHTRGERGGRKHCGGRGFLKRPSESTSAWPRITVSPVILANVSNRSMCIPVTIDRTVETPALIDSGAGGMFIDEQFARDNNIALTPLINRIPVYNVDGTQNKQGVITHYAWRELSVAGITRRTRLLATSLGMEAIILGLPWLRRTNAKIDWQTGKVEFEGSSEAE